MCEPDDLVDEFYRPYVRPLGNMVVLFAQCEADLLHLVAELLGGGDDAEINAVRLLKDADKAKGRIVEMARGQGLAGSELDEFVAGIDGFWADKETRNRLIHDDWFPNLLEEEGELGQVGTRGLTRSKVPEEIIDWRNVEEVWKLAARFQDYSGLFSHRAWALANGRRSAE